MSHNAIKLLEGAIFISDAHYSFKHLEFLEFLKALRTQKIQTPQLILMGDIFDLLFGGVSKTVERNQEAVELINTLSDNIEILYLEGNHDFNLTELFPGVNIFPIKEQPLTCEYKGQSIGLAHGDFNGPLAYRIYTTVVRNPLVLRTLSFFNNIGKQYIINRLDAKLSRKNDCKEVSGFEAYIQRHLSSPELHEYEMFIEGHHHQDRSFTIDNRDYVNLPAFACGLKYMRLGEKQLIAEHFEVSS